MELITGAILAGILLFALGFFLGIFYNSSQSPANTAAHQYLRLEQAFNFDGMVIDCYRQIADGNYANIFGLNPNKPKSYNKFVIFPDLPNRNAPNFYSELDIKLKNLADIVKKQTNQDIFSSEYWTHLLVLAAGVPFVAFVRLDSSAGALSRGVFSLTDDYLWPYVDGRRFLLPQLAVS